MLTEIQKLKIKIMCQGIRISPEAEKKLTDNRSVPLSLFEYPTTAGISLVLPGDIYVNAQFSGQFTKSKNILDYNENEKYFLRIGKKKIAVCVIPLPAFYDKKNKYGFYHNVIMSHTDRMRINPIDGCSFTCQYCDAYKESYRKIPIAYLKEAIIVALKDKNIKPRHLLISGGTPLKQDQEYLKNVYREITAFLKKKKVPVDVMMAPIFEVDFLETLKKWGVYGLSINLEIFNSKYAAKINPQKAKLTKKYYFEFIKRAVEVFGEGRVRSILLIGLEPLSETLKGVEKIASLGSDVVLSPFVPSPNTVLADRQPPTEKELTEVYVKSKKIVDKYGVQIGPRCVPCQHNTLAFPAK